MNMLAVTSR